MWQDFKAREQDDMLPGAQQVKKGKTKAAARSHSPSSPGSTEKVEKRKTKAAARSPSPSSLSADSLGEDVEKATRPRKIVRRHREHAASLGIARTLMKREMRIKARRKSSTYPLARSSYPPIMSVRLPSRKPPLLTAALI